MPTPITWSIAGSSTLTTNQITQFIANANTDFGTDISCLSDLDPSFDLVSGNLLLAQALVRRITTQRGALSFHPDYGIDVTAWLRSGVTQTILQSYSMQLQNELRKDERVFDVDIQASFSYQTQILEFAITVTTAYGPFKLVMSISDVSIDLVLQ